jgi:hypothetical protein
MKLFKSLLLALAVTSIFSVSSFSQTVGIGIEGGINLANISVPTNAITNTRTGMIAGAFAEIGVSEIFSIKPGVRYVMKGFVSTFNGITATEKLSYIELPLLLKVSIPLNKVKPYFEAGPSIGFQVSATEELSDGVNVQEQDAGSLIESTDFGLYFGSGLGFRVAKTTELYTGFGYSLGFSGIIKGANVSVKNNGFRMTAGVKFGL